VIQLDIRRIVVSGLAAGVVVLVVSTLVSTAIQMLFDYDVLSLEGMRSTSDPISVLFFLHPFVIALGLAILYDFAKNSFTGSLVRKGIVLALLGWIVYGIPSAFIVFSSMNYPVGFTINSVFGSLVYMICAGLTIATLSK
jgi:hypothetical protein